MKHEIVEMKKLTDDWMIAYKKLLKNDKSKSVLFKEDILDVAALVLKDFQVQCRREGWKAIK